MKKTDCEKRIAELTKDLSTAQKEQIRHNYDRWLVANKKELNKEYFAAHKIQKFLTNKIVCFVLLAVIIVFSVITILTSPSKALECEISWLIFGTYLMILGSIVNNMRSRWLNEYKIKFYQNQIDILMREGKIL